MKIKKIEITGFKSFVDRTVVVFDHQVTGVVGPNGCGKSNIVDAIRWAMGEQSAKHLRGKSMEDVIFNGSEGRGPSGFAEVSIVFDNTDGLTPPEYRDYAEIKITRRLDRQGSSDYLINGTPVRLMDVTNLFLGTGVGKRAYSIIEQGRIGFIVSSKPEDRRHLIEEAAGVTKFKARKRQAERKMEQTRQNLLRVSDIIQEIERNLASLKRQAQKAERYKRYRSEMRDLELHVASHRWLELTATQKVIGAELEQATAGSQGVRMALRVREAEVEAERLALHQIETVVDRAQTRAFELDNSVRLIESRIEHHNEKLGALRESESQMERELRELASQRDTLRAERDMMAASLRSLEEQERVAAEALSRETGELDRRREAAADAEQTVANARARVGDAQTRIARAEAVLHGFQRRREEARLRLDKMRADREDLARRVVEIEQAAAELRARLEGLASGKAQTASKKSDLEAELERLREDIRQSDLRVETLREELAGRRSRLRSLEEIRQRFEGVGAGVRALMTRHGHDAAAQRDAGVVGLLADRFDCPADLTQALAGALGERLSHVVVDDLEAGARAVSWLRQDERGRATVVPRFPRRVIEPAPHAPEVDGAVGLLLELVGYSPEDTALASHVLGGILVVETLAAARAIHARGLFGGTLVTRDGEVLATDGTLTGGAGDHAAAHMLDVKREIRELEQVVGGLDGELSDAVTRHGELRSAIASRQAALDAARTEAHGAEIAIVTTEKDLRKAEEDAEATRRRGADLEAEIGELVRALEAAGDEENEAHAEIARSKEAQADAEEKLRGADEVSQQRRAAVDAQASRVTEVRVLAAQARERAESDRGAMDRLMRSIEELDAREKRLVGDLLAGARQQGELLARVMLSREELAETVGAAMLAHEELGSVRAEHDAARAAVGAHEEELKILRARLEESSERINALTLRERELAMSLEHLLDHIGERHRVDLTKVLGDYHFREIPDASIKQRIEELVRLIERMGEINLTAIEDYDEKSKRYEYLTAQRKDLEDALTQLDRAIRQMNRESRRLFKDAFENVNLRFQKVFPTMFGGGRAELRLTNPEDLLESGIDIIAQPPGKKLGSLELMSGGEKALTAVSLIFAIFQYKPSPFCLLDEVDAPLDEANIDRFADAIRSMTDRSQFILITHAKRTMEAADVLYGVTMEQPGISKLVAVELTGGRARPANGGSEAQTFAVA